jgi:hypothetical protein
MLMVSIFIALAAIKKIANNNEISIKKPPASLLAGGF